MCGLWVCSFVYPRRDRGLFGPNRTVGLLQECGTHSTFWCWEGGLQARHTIPSGAEEDDEPPDGEDGAVVVHVEEGDLAEGLAQQHDDLARGRGRQRLASERRA